MNKPLQQAGDICQSCYQFWVHQKLSPKHLVHVFNADGTEIRTEAKQLEIIICPHCDGDLILRLPKGAYTEEW